MAAVRTLIRQGQVVNADGMSVKDVLVVDGTIAKVAPRIEAGDGDEVMSADGCLVMPGGIDVHTHLDWSFGGTTTTDDMDSGTRAAIFGGTTTVFNFIQSPEEEPFSRLLDRWRAKGAKAWANYGFHVILAAALDSWIDTLPELAAAGVNSIKVFTAYPGALMLSDAELFRIMRAAARAGILTMVHAENGPVIDVIAAEAVRAGHTAPKYHASTRPAIMEGEAVFRTGAIARVAGSPAYIVHLSSAEALHALRMAQTLGARIEAETCPQYLFLDESVYQDDTFDVARYVYTPPSRSAGDQAKLWEAVAAKDINVVASDHCPFDMLGAKTLGRDDFRRIPNGGPGIETRVPLVLDRALKGQLSLPLAVALLSTNPARRFGLYPRKGVVAAGSDADLIIVDPGAPPRAVSANGLHQRIDYTPYEGWSLKGFPRDVMVNGVFQVMNHRWVADAPGGRFVGSQGGEAGVLH